jgi:hypothetical protein
VRSRLLARLGDGPRVAVRRVAKRRRALGNGVGQLAPSGSTLVEPRVERRDAAPVPLLAQCCEIGLAQRRLQLAADLVLLVV